MLSFILVVLIMIGLFRLTGVMFHIAGKLLGGILGVIGWLILAALAVAVFGAAVFAIPIILIVGIVALIVAAAS